jgi:hypothetical protein
VSASLVLVVAGVALMGNRSARLLQCHSRSPSPFLRHRSMSSSSVIVGSLNRTTAEMVSISTSRSSGANEARARKLLVPNARARGMEDPAYLWIHPTLF